MTSPAATGTPPEASGPGSYDPSGLVTYGDAAQAGARAFVPPPVSAAERDRNMAAYTARCDRCSALPDDLVAAINVALADAKAGRLR